MNKDEVLFIVIGAIILILLFGPFIALMWKGAL